MQPNRPTLLFMLRMAAGFMFLCLIGQVLAVLAGKTIRPQLISFVLTDTSSFTIFSKLHLMDMRTGLVAKVSDQPIGCCPVWSPDGSRIAFIDLNSQAFIWDMRDGTTRPFELPQGSPQIELAGWLPHHQSILLMAFGDTRTDFYQVQPDGSIAEHFEVLNVSVYGSIAWSPNSRFLVFSGLNTDGLHVYRLNLDDGNVQQLTNTGYDYEARLSPDGRLVAFTSVRSGNDDYTLYSMAADGKNQYRLTKNHDDENAPLWSPDGTRLLFQTSININSPRVLNIMNADGTEQRQIADQLSRDAMPAWSLNGSQILFEVRQPNLIAELYVINADGSNRRLLITDDFTITLQSAWQPQP